MIALSRWNIGLAAWIIQDGNYPDFAAGETVEFAVEYYRTPEAEVEPAAADISAQLASETTYEVVAEKVLETPEITVLDIGILAYSDWAAQLPNIAIGNRLRTRLNLGVDPYFYFECHSKNELIPPLIYSWRIHSILRDATPRIEVVCDSGQVAGRTMMVRDESRLAYQEVSQTDAWQESPAGEYILRCELLPILAKRRRQAV